MKTIRSHGYYGWGGELKSRRFSWFPITKYGVKEILNKKRFKIVIFTQIMSIIGLLIAVYINCRPEILMIKKGSSTLVKNLIFNIISNENITFILLVIAMIAGSDSTGGDRKNNTLALYLSRPITPFLYIIGKFFAVFSFLFSYIFIASFLGYTFQSLMLSDFSYLLLIIPSFIYSVLLSSLITAIIIFSSWLVKGGRKSGIVFLAIFFIPSFLSQILYAIHSFRAPWIKHLSFLFNIKNSALLLFLFKGYRELTPYASILIILLVTVGAIFLLNSKIKRAEL